MCPVSSLSLESKTFQSGNLTWHELDMFQLENTLSRKHFLLFPSVKKVFHCHLYVFSEGNVHLTYRTLLCSSNLGGTKNVLCDLCTVHCLKYPLTLELEEESSQKVSLERSLKTV